MIVTNTLKRGVAAASLAVRIGAAFTQSVIANPH